MRLVCMLLCFLSHTVSAQGVVSEWQVDFKGGHTGAQVKLEHETEPISLGFQPGTMAGQFRASLDVNDLLGSIPSMELTHPFQLVVDWDKWSETLYVTVSRLAPPPRVVICIDSPEQSTSFKLADLERIELLSGGLDAMVTKYLRARRFHLYWRGLGQHEHQIAIRSARVWFDAATALSTRQQRVFRSDAAVIDIVDQYLAMAAANPDSSLAARIRAHFPQRVVMASRAQIAAAPFSVVGEIPNLISEGRITEAALLNSAALRSLQEGTDELRDVVLAAQRINVEMLSANGRYLDSLER